MEKESKKLSNMLLIGLLAIVIVGGIIYSIIYTANIITSFPKSSNVEDYIRSGSDSTTDSGVGVKPLAVVTTAAETPQPIALEPSGINPPNPMVDAQYKESNSAYAWITKPLSNRALDWVTRPVNQIIMYFFEPEPEAPAVESGLGNLVISDVIANPFE